MSGVTVIITNTLTYVLYLYG